MIAVPVVTQKMNRRLNCRRSIDRIESIRFGASRLGRCTRRRPGDWIKRAAKTGFSVPPNDGPTPFQ